MKKKWRKINICQFDYYKKQSAHFEKRSCSNKWIASFLSLFQMASDTKSHVLFKFPCYNTIRDALSTFTFHYKPQKNTLKNYNEVLPIFGYIL